MDLQIKSEIQENKLKVVRAMESLLKSKGRDILEKAIKDNIKYLEWLILDTIWTDFDNRYSKTDIQRQNRKLLEMLLELPTKIIVENTDTVEIDNDTIWYGG